MREARECHCICIAHHRQLAGTWLDEGFPPVALVKTLGGQPYVNVYFVGKSPTKTDWKWFDWKYEEKGIFSWVFATWTILPPWTLKGVLTFQLTISLTDAMSHCHGSKIQKNCPILYEFVSFELIYRKTQLGGYNQQMITRRECHLICGRSLLLKLALEVRLQCRPQYVRRFVLKKIWVVTSPGGRHTQDIKLSLMGSQITRTAICPFLPGLLTCPTT